MSTLGRLAYSIRTNYGHGLPTAYYRDVVRPRILQTPPTKGIDSTPCEIHVLTCSTDWLNLIWALKSFYHFSKRRYGLCIHDDGTLKEEARFHFRRHFPESRLISRAEADAVVFPSLVAYPLCAELRRRNTLCLKLFDFRHYLRSERMLLLDSDILFFSEPRELLLRIEDPGYWKNTVNEDLASAYTVDAETVKRTLGFDLQPRFNSGLGLIHNASLNLDWIERFMGLPGIVGHFWRIEQTLFALCSSMYGVELLPEEYRVRVRGHSAGLPCRHYIGQIRHLMYREGLSRLCQNGFIDSLRQSRDSSEEGLK
jgi:hypothetical protein